MVHLYLFLYIRKFKWDFYFITWEKKHLTIKLFKYLREMALRSSNEKKLPGVFLFVNINVNENAF